MVRVVDDMDCEYYQAVAEASACCHYAPKGNRMKKLFCLLVFIIFVAAGCSFTPRNSLLNSSSITSIPDADPADGQVTIPVGLSFPPIRNASELEFTLAQMQALNMSLVRIGTDWAYREVDKGSYYWDPLDERINTLHENGHLIMFTIPSSGPDWACGEITEKETCVFREEQAFRAYVTALITRYKGKIDKIQFGNEWDNTTWYPGTAADYVRFNNIVYDVVKDISPETTVVLGGLTAAYSVYVTACKNGETLSFEALDLKNGADISADIERIVCSRDDLEERVRYVIGEARYDMVDLHLYDDSENWPLYTDTLRQLTDKPLVVSEFGGPSSAFEYYSQEYHAQRLEQYLLTIEDLPIEEAYYFTLVDNPTTYHSHSGLFTFARWKKEAFDVMQRMVSPVGGE